MNDPPGGSYGKLHRTTKILSHARRRGGVMAARGAGAAGGDAADHRFLGLGHACGPRPVGRRFCAAAARTRLDRGSQPYDRVSVGEGSADRAAELAAEFVRRKVDVIVTYANPMVVATKQATSVIPIVFAAAAD